jgi:hypothetical protein
LIKKKSARGGPAFGWEKIKTIRQLADIAKGQRWPAFLSSCPPSLSKYYLVLKVCSINQVEPKVYSKKKSD